MVQTMARETHCRMGASGGCDDGRCFREARVCAEPGVGQRMEGFLRAKGSHFKLESGLTEFDLHVKSIFLLHMEAGLGRLRWMQGGQWEALAKDSGHSDWCRPSEYVITGNMKK